jgi:hypothetical protein
MLTFYVCVLTDVELYYFFDGYLTMFLLLLKLKSLLNSLCLGSRHHTLAIATRQFSKIKSARPTLF